MQLYLQKESASTTEQLPLDKLNQEEELGFPGIRVSDPSLKVQDSQMPEGETLGATQEKKSLLRGAQKGELQRSLGKMERVRMVSVQEFWSLGEQLFGARKFKAHFCPGSTTKTCWT